MARAASTRRAFVDDDVGDALGRHLQRDEHGGVGVAADLREADGVVAVGEVLDGLWCSGVHRSNLGDGRIGRCQRHGPGSATTPSGSGGRPAIVHSRSAHACRCTPIAPVSGVHDARTSISTVALRSASPAKLSDTTRVTVPASAV